MTKKGTTVMKKITTGTWLLIIAVAQSAIETARAILASRRRKG
jgi:hypothetical protein